MIILWFAIAAVVLLAVPASATESQTLKTEKDKLSYTIGVSLGKNFKQQGLDIDADMVLKGLKDVLQGNQLLLSEEDMKKVMTAFQNQMRQKQQEAMKAKGEENKKAGEAFLAENKKKEGVVTLPSGLQYKILKAGEGKKPTEGDTVEVHYRGTLINGTEFDSSQRRGKPAVFKLANIIPGWREALLLMPVGSKWQLFIPPALAYGERGAGQQIPPQATLIFEVELLGIK